MEEKKKEKKLTPREKEIIITIIVLIGSIVIGFIIGKALFDALYR